MQVRTLRRRYSGSRRPYPALEHADLVVQTFDEYERDLFLRRRVGGDPVLMILDQLRKLLERVQSLPLERGAPVV